MNKLIKSQKGGEFLRIKLKSVRIAVVNLAVLLSVGVAFALSGDGSEHRTDKEKLDSLKASLPFLEDKVASTIEGASSAPVAFHGEVQMRAMYHDYYELPRMTYTEVNGSSAESKVGESYLYPARQGITLGGSEPVLKIGMVVTPSRNTVLWAKTGFSASYQGVKPSNQTNSVSGDTSFHYMSTLHNENRSIGIMEDMSAGIAIRSKPASFMLKMGAMNWRESSPLSIWKAQPRMFAWEYLPYEIEQPIARYYEYNIAKGEKVGRAAWNRKSFQGIDLEVTNLPGDVKGLFMYGVGDPFDMFERHSMDMAVDNGYAGDEGSIVETGIGDSYRKHLFYRISKKFTEQIEVGFNNSFISVSEDITQAGFKYDFVFNTKFDVGLYNSTWDIGGKTVKLDSKKSYDDILAAEVTATSIGEGYYLEPTNFSLDFKGKINSKLSYMANVGFSAIDTTFVAITNGSEGRYLATKDDGFTNINDSNGVIVPGRIHSSKKVSGWETDGSWSTYLKSSLATYIKLSLDTRVNVDLDFMYAGADYYSPYSFVATHDLFFARGSNELGAGKFLGTETSPYTKNMVSSGITVAPDVPWYGHLKFKYGFNKQLDADRDVIFLNYRLNGDAMHSTFNSYMSKWGLGKITQTYDFAHHQDKALSPIDRVGDESYGSYIMGEESRLIASPTSGGMRSDAHSVFEGFVPYKDPTQLILNHYSKSSSVSERRDITEIWNDDSKSFIDARDSIGAANSGRGTVIISKDGKDSTFYSMSETSGDSMFVEKSDGSLDTIIVKTTSDNGFVPVTSKNSFNFAFDWALDVGKYIGYKNDLFLSLYYETSGITRTFKPMAFNPENSDVMLTSHYLRTEPAIAITKDFYILGLFGWERWLASSAWLPSHEDDGAGNVVQNKLAEKTVNGFRESKLKTTDLALGIGFDWDMLKRLSLHARYKWFAHKDEVIKQNEYKGNLIALELKAFF